MAKGVYLRISNNDQLRIRALLVESIDLVRDVLRPLLDRGAVAVTTGCWIVDGL